MTHRLAAAYADAFAGQTTRSSSPQGRFAADAAVIDGRTMTGATAYGKHLFVEFGDLGVHVHLGLAGKLAFADDAQRPVIGMVRWRLETASRYADLRGPAACALVSMEQIGAIEVRLGPDPLRADADPDRGWSRVSRSKAPIATLLMDQKVAAGVGNIFRAEVLYRHRLDPMTEGRALRRAQWDAIWADLVVLMRYGVEHGRIDTVRPEHEPEAMGRAPRVDRHGGEVYVYRRQGQPCLVCGTAVRMAELAGRNLFWCPRCQRPRRAASR